MILPFDPTGERMTRGGVLYVVYEFALQLHAIQFWDRFDGRWLRHGDLCTRTSRPICGSGKSRQPFQNSIQRGQYDERSVAHGCKRYLEEFTQPLSHQNS